MRLKVASRRSDLARWQAVQVARAFEGLESRPSVEYIFKASMGDQNLDAPLAAMGAKGVFTEDFYADLVSGLCDLVVHSWKDLPVEERADTQVAMTLKRADERDVLLVPESVWRTAEQTGLLPVLTSSPRRAYNLAAALPLLLPGETRVEFENVRGNLPTRLRKMHEQGRALIVAKAGLDRLLEAESEGFTLEDATVRQALTGCRFQILPVSLNPPAAAQGALAVEIPRANEALAEMCQILNHEKTMACVRQEREILARHGGGCHQKIGVAVMQRDYGRVYALRGLTDDGVTLSEWRIDDHLPWAKAVHRDQVFPQAARENAWFDRRTRDLSAADRARLDGASGVYVARAEAWPRGYLPRPGQVVWTAGARTWAKLARRGVWVNGTSDGLGESEDPGLDWLVGPVNWCKLTHTRSNAGAMGVVATYELAPAASHPDLAGRTHFFWMSKTSFERAFELYPDPIRAGWNGCGPGVTHEFLRQFPGLKNPVKVFAGLEQFLAESIP